MRPSGGEHTCAELGATCGAKVRCHPARSRLAAAGGVAKQPDPVCSFVLCNEHICPLSLLLCTGSALLFYFVVLLHFAVLLFCCFALLKRIHHLWTLSHFKPYLIVFLQQDPKRTRSPRSVQLKIPQMKIHRLRTYISHISHYRRSQMDESRQEEEGGWSLQVQVDTGWGWGWPWLSSQPP